MKKIFVFIFGGIAFFALILNVNAASASISAPSSVINGSSFTVRINLSGVAAWNAHLDAAGPVKNCNIKGVGDDPNASNTSKSFSATCTATGTGTITLSLSGDITSVDASGNGKTTYLNGKKYINVVNKTTSSSSNKNTSSSKNTSSKTTNNNDNSKSADNNLKSLSVEGAELSFNKDTTTYNLSVGNDVKKIKINAEANNSKATITGTGEKDVKEGDNKFDVVVTAENGDTKTYTINVNVDSQPITVTVGGKKYTLVKKKDELPELNIEHEDLTLNFDGQEVPAYRIDKINFVLVGLRDEEGNIKLYKYDSYKDNEKPDKYTLFMQFSLPQMFVSYLEFPKDLIPDGFKKYKEKINGEKVEVYKLAKDSDYCLFYGINMETGEKNIYKYDTKEKTFQIYDREELESLEKQMEEFKYIIAGLIGFSALLLIIIVIICATRRRKFKKMIKKYENKKMAQL